jgi:epoxyqueuosine reductase
MNYLATERSLQRRADPRQILPECQSILVLGIRYANPASVLPPAGSNESIYGRIAAYAWGDDYHDILAHRLEKLVFFMGNLLGQPIPNRWYTDTGPVLERELGQSAGLGWIGKNTCLIHPRFGSYFLLAEIFLGVALEADPPFEYDRCGACQRCLEACPTGCILSGRILDARRCISYLTIELKGPIPPELRPQTGNRVFGCDRCQEVCPWNQRFAGREAVVGLTPKPGMACPDLIAELTLTPEAFKRKFKGSPVQRARRRGYLRNVATAFGNSRNPAAVAVLGQSLRSEVEPLVRGHVAWALEQIGGEEARLALLQAASSENDASVLAEIHSAILRLTSS